MTPETEILHGMKALRKALLARIKRDEREERRAAWPTLPRRELADYDTSALGRRIRPMIERDGRGWRAVAGDIGVTSSDLSRIMAGQQIAAGKVFAICDWAGIDPRRFYVKPLGASRRAPGAKRIRKQKAGAPAGGRKPGPQSRPRPAAGRPDAQADECFTGKALKREVRP